MPAPRLPAITAAQVVVDELLRGGMADIVLAPGSRSAPLALSLAAAEREGRCRLHVRIDERSAGYLALGLARGSGGPVAVVTTSGTAAVNLHPAVVEAHHAGVPLIALTADRPPRLRATGANQTIDQPGAFAAAPRWTVDLVDHDPVVLRSTISRALAVAADPVDPGPVHVNAAFADPLVGQLRPWDDLPSGRPGGRAWMERRHAEAEPPRIPIADLLGADGNAMMQRGLVVLGDAVPRDERIAAAALALEAGWPVIVEPTAGIDAPGGTVLEHGTLIAERVAAEPDWVPEVVVTAGRVGLHRGVARLVAAASHHVVVDPRPPRTPDDPQRSASTLVAAVPAGPVRAGDRAWQARWVGLDAELARSAADLDRDDRPLDDAAAARIAARAAGPQDLLVLGPSWPIRQVSLHAGALRAEVIANRGTSGIDGVVSTAWGAALAHGRAVPGSSTIAILGDLTALYDRNGLLVPAGEARPDLVYVVVDNNGGGIFADLEQGAPEFAADFDRVFRTPLDADPAGLLAVPGIAVDTVTAAAGLRDALAEARERGGVSVVVARIGPPRAADRGVR